MTEFRPRWSAPKNPPPTLKYSPDKTDKSPFVAFVSAISEGATPETPPATPPFVSFVSPIVEGGEPETVPDRPFVSFVSPIVEGGEPETVPDRPFVSFVSPISKGAPPETPPDRPFVTFCQYTATDKSPGTPPLVEGGEPETTAAQPVELVRAWLAAGVFDGLPLLPLGPTGGLHHPRDIARVSLADAPLGGVAGERARAMLARLVAIIQTGADPVSGSQVPDSRTPEREAPTRNDSLDKTDNSVRAPEDGIAAARRLFDDLAEKPATEPIRHCVSCGAELPPRLRYRCAGCTRAAYRRLGRPLPPSLAWLAEAAEEGSNP